MELLFRAISEERVGDKWRALFHEHWPAYEHWYLRDGIEARPTYREARRQLAAYMPEIVPTYEALCDLAGGGDLAARFLTLYRPPAYITGCSQVVWPGNEPILIRNYDYSPALCEGVILRSRWHDQRVLAMVDCLWGALDGVNDAGLAVSLTFGGRRVTGDGFGIPLIIRYVLEFHETVGEAVKALQRIPCHMAYNVTLVDRAGAFATVLLAPDRKPRVTQLPIAANHQLHVDWHTFARATATLERERFLFFRLQDAKMTPERLTACFLRSPLYTTAYGQHFGTVYTAVYRPRLGEGRYLWPDGSWRHRIDSFEEGLRHQAFYPSGTAPKIAES